MTSTPTSTEAPQPDAPPDPPAHGSLWSAFQPVLLRLHFYVGILVGPFLLVAAVTGLLYSVSPQLEAVVHRHELTVDDVGATRLDLADQVAAARAAHPEGQVVQVQPAATPDGTTRVVLAAADVPEGKDRTVFVDPYTAEVRGSLATYTGFLPVRWTLDDLHRNLLLGEPGRVYSELAASWLWVVVLGGVAMWVARSARRGRWRRLVVPEHTGPARRRTLSWHGVVGLVVALGLLVLSATGMTWSVRAGANVGELRTAWGWTTTYLDTTLPGAAAGEEDPHAEHRLGDGTPDAVLTAGIGVDGVLAVARDEGLRDPLRLTPPADATHAWGVAEHGGGWPSRADSIAVDPMDGAVVSRVDFADQHLVAKLAHWGIYAHMGELFGVANQVVLAGLATGLITLVVLGYRMWWQRRPTREPGFGPGPLLPPGALRAAPRALTVVVLALAALVGWFIPLFGVPLLVFLLIDTALAARHRRTTPA
ncbi:PepSY-associated TM helix domain-containing protein [Cellulomonas dongxiuzhuiae]|uniref:PepSY-associated TM helix domain-containing protein n=1 Tax=Cellulomonas dongxiuzhuiae TaxID=2819979 RepID=UPI001AAF70C8|nr:PepSY domain-containing protein [Cellulomonas dongxiuzhuiae]MBO3089738.1 PepSY domain-containing protein [Cellulomonas dongxiuzhuiae]